MKKFLIICIGILILLPVVNGQEPINYKGTFPGGGRLLMNINTTFENVYFDVIFPNQRNISFNYLPEVDSLNVHIVFKNNELVEDYRYSILADSIPLVVNKTIDKKNLKDLPQPDGDLLWTSIGKFPLKAEVITVMVYSVANPLNLRKSIFYGRPIPKAKIKQLSKQFDAKKGDYLSRVIDPKEKTNFIFTDKDSKLIIVKEISDIDYLYFISIKDKQTDKIIYESKLWDYGAMLDEKDRFFPMVRVDKSIFEKSGDYEIIIQPQIPWERYNKSNLSAQELEQYISRYTLSISLENKTFTIKDLLIYTLFATSIVGLVFLIILYLNKKANKRKLDEKDKQEHIAKLQLSSIRSQLNPHFLFNALAGIQNLMNKNELVKANTYLAKFARLTRSILEDKDLISLSEEKKLMDDYLQMEQLRFGFRYEINYSENLDLDNTEIPSMLLQPFVENAVKHGVSGKGQNAEVVISFLKEENDLLLMVVDNGRGFDTRAQNTGLGHLLSKNRINLLNYIYKENQFSLAMESSDEGTNICITLKDWL